ncbi:hypothetical protein BN1325_50005 [Staphylococcus aureus]|nr:hypothetical protein BN1323_50006 [Staphylococcus aureus]CRI25270.1 hypothetical protein BN1322_50006 [Staphylococcus aureus]CRI25538.1 hypothetical protein SAET23_50005 [Staphylococcus aureus]CRI29714.1 hypothetical protein BN1325_50005 [Staphylococcus aureus]CRI29857.1 hypothetical protein SAET23_50005 [Staphylococcus aureus]
MQVVLSKINYIYRETLNRLHLVGRILWG